ncbi:MAG: DUF928 domain-containing protein [Limnoraphis sp.]
MRFKVISAIALLSLTGLGTEIRANTSVQLSQFRPADTTEPAYREGGGTRGGSVFEGGEGSIALTPMTGGVTVAEYPTLLILHNPYIPERSSRDVTESVMVLEDEAGNVVYETTIQLPLEESIIAINLKQNETSVPLEINQTYRWYIFTSSTYMTIEAPITRISLSSELTQALEKANLQERFNLYKKNGIWYEALLTLFELRRANPNDTTLIQEWQELLQSIGFEKIADVPLLLIEAPTSQNQTQDSLESSELNTTPNQVTNDAELTFPFRPPEQGIPHTPDGGSR